MTTTGQRDRWRIAGAQLRLTAAALRATLTDQLASIAHLPRAWSKRSRRQRSRRAADALS